MPDTIRLDQLPDGTPMGTSGATITPNADGTFDATSAAGTFTIDVDGSADLRIASNRAEFVGGTTAQELRVYNTDDGLGNAEWFAIRWTSDDVWLEVDDSGSGTADRINISAVGIINFLVGGFAKVDIQSDRLRLNVPLLVPAVDRGSSLGAAGFRFLNLFLDPPTSDPGVAGQVWSDGGTLKISAG